MRLLAFPLSLNIIPIIFSRSVLLKEKYLMKLPVLKHLMVPVLHKGNALIAHVQPSSVKNTTGASASNQAFSMV